MKLTAAVLMIALVGTAGWYGYTRWYAKPPTDADDARRAFPVEHALTDRSGRTVLVRLVARDVDEIQFVRLSDDAAFNYPIASLAEADQEFVRQFPETGLAPLDHPRISTPSRPEPGSVPPTIESRLRRERAALKHKLELLDLELKKEYSKSPILSRDQIVQQMHDSRNRIIDIDKELLEIAFRAGEP